MLQAFVITLREGLEAFLIVAISLAYLRKTGRRELVPAIHWGIGTSILLSIGTGAFWGVFVFTLLMITREGMETAMLMNALLFQVKAMSIASGALGGTLVAAFIAFLWSRFGHRVNLARFFQVTAVFMLVFVVQLLIYGFHELAEAHVLPNSEVLHWATEPYGPDGVYGHYLTYMLVALPLGWLAFSSLFGKGPRSQAA